MGIFLAAKVFTIARAPITRGFGRSAVGHSVKKKLIARELKHHIAKKVLLGTVSIVLDPYNEFLVPHSGGRLISSEQAALNVWNPSSMGIPQAFRGQAPTKKMVKTYGQTFVAFTLDPLDFYWELGTHSKSEIKKKLSDDIKKDSTEVHLVPIVQDGRKTSGTIRVRYTI